MLYLFILIKKKIPFIKFKDGNPINCRIENLEECPGFELKNYGLKNKLGFKGVEQQGDIFYGRIKINGKRLRTKSFSNPQEAHAAYLKAKEEYATTKTISEPSSN